MQSEQRSPSTTPDEAVPAIAGDALARRRLLLKGLGKGSAAVAVLVPIQTLAAIEPLSPRLCTVSGVQSNVGSGRTGGTTTNCSGYAPSHFATLANWPGFTPGPGNSAGSASFQVGTQTYTDATRFNAIFGNTGSNTKLLDVFTLSTSSASEKVWAAALLSAVKKLLLGLGPTQIGSAGYFPYTPAEVVALFTSARKVDAEAFFKNYLETQT